MRRKTRLARALTCILSPEQYAQKQHATPYTYTLSDGGAVLCFIGVHHTTAVEDALFPHIKEQFTRVAPTLVVVEGMQNLVGFTGTERLLKSLTPAEAIARGGEAVFTITQAQTHGVPWQSYEPSDAALMRHLTLQLYSPEQLVAWYVLRLLGQYHARRELMPFVAYVSPFLSYLASATKWDKSVCTLEAAFTTAEPILKHQPNTRNAERAREYTDPIPWTRRWEQQTLFNDITRDALRFRDQKIVQRVGDQVLRGERVLVVYGAGHAVMQEPAYRYLLNA